MYYLIEALLVGVYSSLLYLLFSQYVQNFYYLLLIVGFFKHLLGYLLGIHTWYCYQNGKGVAISKTVLRDSILESLAFLVVGSALGVYLKGWSLYFMIGVLLHILAEHLYVHDWFIKESCV